MKNDLTAEMAALAEEYLPSQPKGAKLIFDKVQVDESTSKIVVQVHGTGFIPGTVVKMCAHVTKVSKTNYEDTLIDGVHQTDHLGEVGAQLEHSFTPDAKNYYDFAVTVRVAGFCSVKQHNVVVETAIRVIEVPANF